MIRKIIHIIIFLLIPFLMQGQRLTPVYSQYWLNGLAINPAYAGSRECFSNTVLYRNQWMGFEGAPVTQTLSSHSSFPDEKHAVGLFLFHEQIGVSNNYDIYGNYAFRFKFAGGKFALGLKAGTSIIQNDWTQIEAGEEYDPEFTGDENETVYQPNVGFGLYYYTNRFYFGASIPSFLSYKKDIASSKYQMYNDINNYDFLISAGVLIGKSDILKFRPTILARYRLNNTFQVDAGANAILYNTVWFGLSYRHNDEFAVMLEYQVNNQIRVGAAYDFVMGDLAGKNDGSFEIILRYEFKYRIKAENPRFF
ncbi:MAG: hypothetical protein A2X13_15120 [Bacteroidetes bacterium GWC2_33_15]|nr:MAG: hypothetical protein A2X10_07185 [Bacteroidetes bacterium GWA2_33_15]OFX50200.1 MAG: hypothetical protein A2X13_15120 [Bacteroidetes bacterium GWC2_33_15]OFX65352.1 MAG: hypothetical protein A2X15_04695 [Bacteroidetes bacterium GWB2_32_14]OFX70579.1 MAG: hypothetical protein A2X14_04750 [Bacteroidetes bacterium GWD2_33_33]HAN19546.1 hypothetical protein [Bacteroidales bacterium]